MSKNTAGDKHRNIRPHLSPSQLTRQPIHGRAEEDEDCGDDETRPDSSEKLYPVEDIKEDLEKIRRQKKSESQEKRQPTKCIAKAKEEAGKSSDFCSLRNILFSLAIVVLFLGISIFHREETAPESHRFNRTIDLTEFISDMKNKFERQDHQTFHILKSSLKRILDENSEPIAPSVFTIITNKGAEITASKFGTFIVQELASEHSVSINESVIHRNADDLKYVIDSKIKSKFDNRSLNVAVVDRFHNIPIDAAMIFHSYCDHENAPFKRAIFLFIVHLNRKIPENSNSKYLDTAAMEALRSIWLDTSDDIVDSLITRLTVNVINIK